MMSDHQEYMKEKQAIDALLEEGYRITEVDENLSGAFVTFELHDHVLKNKRQAKQLHVRTPDGRKYFSNLII
jgi:hypothetical protein